MISHSKLATVITAAMLVASTAAQAGDQYSFPSPSGALIAASTPTFVPPVIGASGLPVFGGTFGSRYGDQIPSGLPLAPPSYAGRFGMQTRGGDAYGYGFLTHSLASQSYRNYEADYSRLFGPGYAVTAWTDRVAGFVELGYGGAVDSWTAASYYMNRLRGPARRRDSAPDLTLMPELRPHPELENTPTFSNP